MASGLLTAAEAGPWHEDKVPPGDRGISFHWLCDFVADKLATVNEPRQLALQQADLAREQNKMAQWDPHISTMATPEIPPYYFLNTHALVSQFIVPLTKEIGGPLFAQVPLEHRGPPTAFISHTWNSLLIGPSRQRIGTLDAVYEEKDEFVWIDFACYNQNRVVSSDISADMFGIIKKIGKVFVAVTPTPLYNRSWCLWELYSADVSGLALDFRICHGFRNDKIQSVNALYRSFTGVENARSIDARSEAQIRDAFISQHGSAEKADAAVKDMLRRQLSGRWDELQPDDGPLKFSADPWVADPDGAALRAYDPYWEPGLMDCLIYGGTETVRAVFAGAGVYIGAQETATLSVQKTDPDNLRLIDALQNEDADLILNVVFKTKSTVDINQPLPFRNILSFIVAPPLHFLIPWATQRTIETLLLAGANVDLPWTLPPGSQSAEATQREGLVRALLNGVGDPHLANWTPLMLAVQRGDVGICKFLISSRASVSFSCPQTGLTALHVAVAAKRADIEQLLIESSAPVDAQLVSGITGLHIAAIVDDADSVALLLKAGAYKDLRDRTAQTALDWARRDNHTATAELLETTTVTTYDTLKRIFTERRPALTDTFVTDVLWTLNRDPAATASLALSYENPAEFDVVAKFDKQAGTMTSTVRVSEHGDDHPLQTTETQHSLVEGVWQAKVVRKWQG